ncbi:hypothetical protein MSG28_004463 [Choristoneura fumiferana]|uniref:Uncharacterized protein n=1 Tax=Choristoneura fumiferana TaxID=7141 RepID=A0ACC0K683_CHOFU|nr:hypothetical protein MSG28_004463 [Choristoneura fumiferana]
MSLCAAWIYVYLKFKFMLGEVSDIEYLTTVSTQLSNTNNNNTNIAFFYIVDNILGDIQQEKINNMTNGPKSCQRASSSVSSPMLYTYTVVWCGAGGAPSIGTGLAGAPSSGSGE